MMAEHWLCDLARGTRGRVVLTLPHHSQVDLGRGRKRVVEPVLDMEKLITSRHTSLSLTQE